MGKSLKGKELGVGISQKKDGSYLGRVTDRNGERSSKTFKKLAECKKWVADMQYKKEHGNILDCKVPTVTSSFEYWLYEIKKEQVRSITFVAYEGRWKNHIKPFIGDKLTSEILPVHCINILQNAKKKGMKTSSINKIKMLLNSYFKFCKRNKMIDDNPITEDVYAVGEKSKERRFLTKKEQIDFLISEKGKPYYNACAFILQTGLRVGEINALSWNDIDFENRIAEVSKSAKYHSKDGWEISEPKTENAIRKIPLTEEAINILIDQREKKKKHKISNIKYANLIFSNKNGNPIYCDNYDKYLKKYAERANIPQFSIHSLRHTFATRCAGAKMPPKVLQKIMGHSTIQMTMNFYVHADEEMKTEEMRLIEKSLKVV